MQKVLEIAQWLIANYQMIITLMIGLLTAIIAIALVIPGPQPEAFLQKIVDFLKKFSKKPEVKPE